jgi:hypothetical protein|tara:strand:- start:3133 stop:3501 length:369 start_codon:yes stop_codon:yes gene_type:complete
MKIATLTAATLIMASTAVSAMDFTIAGQTLSAGGKADVNYDTGTELWAMEFVPSVGLNAWGTDFKASTTFDVINLNEGDVFQGIDFEAGYSLGQTGLRAYGEIGTDADLEFGDATVGVSFSF